MQWQLESSIYVRLSKMYWSKTIFFSYSSKQELDPIFAFSQIFKPSKKFRFPQFEPVNWLAALKLKNDLSDLNSDSTLCPSHLLSGIKALLQALKLWLPDLETKVFSKLLLFIGIVYSDTLNWNFLKFIYSEKGIKILWNLHLTFDWHYIGQK